MWNDITLTSQPSDVPRGDCKEGWERKKKCQVLLIAVWNKVSVSSSDEEGRNGGSACGGEGSLGGERCRHVGLGCKPLLWMNSGKMIQSTDLATNICIFLSSRRKCNRLFLHSSVINVVVIRRRGGTVGVKKMLEFYFFSLVGEWVKKKNCEQIYDQHLCRACALPASLPAWRAQMGASVRSAAVMFAGCPSAGWFSLITGEAPSEWMFVHIVCFKGNQKKKKKSFVIGRLMLAKEYYSV